MNGRTVKAMRRQARGEAMAAVEATAPAIKGVYDNEVKTRKRVDDLERLTDGLVRDLAAATAFRSRPFWGRLKWLLTGR
jgi:hypothetical protein